MGSQCLPDSTMARVIILLLLGLTGVISQDTHYCPDGWHVSNIGDTIECILLGGLEERVTKDDARVICASHEGWLVDMDEGTGGEKNSLLKQLISQADGHRPDWPGPQFDDQWWIGATCAGPHGSHNWGDWKWDHTGADIEWDDWSRNDSNDWRTQNCLAFLKIADVFGFGSYHWNDWDCKDTARYICERAPLTTPVVN